MYLLHIKNKFPLNSGDILLAVIDMHNSQLHSWPSSAAQSLSQTMCFVSSRLHKPSRRRRRGLRITRYSGHRPRSLPILTGIQRLLTYFSFAQSNPNSITIIRKSLSDLSRGITKFSFLFLLDGLKQILRNAFKELMSLQQPLFKSSVSVHGKIYPPLPDESLISLRLFTDYCIQLTRDIV